MRVDAKLAGLLSNFFLDISKASFIAAFITPQAVKNVGEVVILLTKTFLAVTLSLLISWRLAQLGDDG